MIKGELMETGIIKMAAKAGAEAALEKLEKERLKQLSGRNDKRLRNTKLLLKNYRLFKRHALDSVYEVSQISDESAIDILDLMWDPSNSNLMFVESIKKSAMKTNIIMAHIDDMLEIYKFICEKSNRPEDMRRYRVIEAMYISDENISAEKIAEAENIDVRTVYKDIDSASDKIAALIFGVDWIG